jgi:hypothetical protein
MRKQTPISIRLRRGSVCVIVAVCAIVMISIVAITLDGGTLQTERRRAQNVADAAAMAAASVLYENYPKDQGKDPNKLAQDAAFGYAKTNGYANDASSAAGADNSNTSLVEVNIPPKSGPYAGKDSYVEVLVTYHQQRYFSRVFGADPIPVKARAVARGAWVAPKIGVLVLEYTGKAALSAQGNGAFTETGAAVIVNSNNESAVVDGGNGLLKAESFQITGNYTTSGNGQMITSPVPDQIYTGVHPTPDPLAYLPVPTAPPPGTITKTPLGSGNFEYLLSPGSYYANDLPNFNTGDVVIFQQASAGNGGIHYLAAGGFKSTGATIMMDTATTGGMMLYNAATGTSDNIKITGNPDGSVNMTPLTSGPYKGLTIWQARNAYQEITIEGNGDFTVKGTLYAAAAELQVAGNGAVSNIGSQYVSRELAISGNGNVNISWAGEEVAPTRIITLVE